MFHDYYSQNPKEYYHSIETDGTNFRVQRDVHVFVDANVTPRDQTFLARDDGAGFFKEEWRRAVPLFATPLNSVADTASAGAWWDDRRPLIMQTGPLGLIEMNQRDDVRVLPNPDPNTPDKDRPTRPSPSFQGFRLITVDHNVMTRVQYVKRADLQ